MNEFSIVEDINQLPEMAARLGRECGSCSLCCKVLGIDELDKPRGRWCDHCKPGGKRCTIYDERPASCREFYCQWMIDASFGDEWRPSRCKMVLKMAPNDKPSPAMRLDVHVDIAHPNAWQREPYYKRLKTFSRDLAVYVVVGPRCYLVFPDEDVERLVAVNS